MKRKIYRIEEEYPTPGDLYQTRVGSRLRILQFYRMEGRTVWLIDGKRVYQRMAEQVQAVRIDEKLLLSLGFRTKESEGPTRENQLVLDRDHLHFEAYERGDVMHIEITPDGTNQKTYACCDFLHELQHLKRLKIAGIQLPFSFFASKSL